MRASLLSFALSSSLVVALALTSGLSAQRRVYVDAAAPPSGDGQSWTTAYNDLSQALTGLPGGSEVWVAAGGYIGSFGVGANVRVYGGFKPGATTITQRDFRADQTVLDGNRSNRTITIGNGSLIDGLIIQSGYSSGGGGAGLASNARVTIRNCIFRDNQIFTGRGVALFIGGGQSATIEDSIFTSNDFGGNVVDISGNANVVFRHNIVWNNEGNGLNIGGGATVVARNNIFGLNQGRGAEDSTALNVVTLENNMFHQNVTAEFRFRGSDFTTATQINGITYASGNQVADPLFTNAPALDFRVGLGSPCIDTGIADGQSGRCYYDFPRNLDGDFDRTITPDIGIHEYSDAVTTVTGNATPGGSVTVTLTGSLVGFMLVGTQTGPGVTVDPFGTLFLDLSLPTPGFFLGNLPSVNPIPIPASIPPGTSVPFQGVVVQNGIGNLSNLVDVLIL